MGGTTNGFVCLFVTHKHKLLVDNAILWFSRCGQYQCRVTRDRTKQDEASAIIFRDIYMDQYDLPKSRQPGQFSALLRRESPRMKIRVMFDYTKFGPT